LPVFRGRDILPGMTRIPLASALVLSALAVHAGNGPLHRPLDWNSWSGGGAGDESRFRIVADPLGEGWSLLAEPVLGQDTLPVVRDARYVLVRPDGVFANLASTERTGAALPDTGAGLCGSEGLRRAVASWMDSVAGAGTLASPFGTRPRTIRPWGTTGTFREARGTSLPDVRICLTDLRVPWRSDSDSGVGVHPTGFVVARREGAWRLAVADMEGNPAARAWQAAADSAVRGLRRGAPDLETLWPNLLRGGWKRSGPGFLLDPWAVERVGTEWVACLDTVWHLGGDCLRWKSDGKVSGTARLRTLTGWRNCLGMACAPVDTDMVVDLAKDVLAGIRTAEETARENGGPLPRKLSEVFPGAPDPVFDIRWTPPKMAAKGWLMTRSPLSLCLRKDPRSCLSEGAAGCFEGTGLFRSAHGRVRRYEFDGGRCGGY